MVKPQFYNVKIQRSFQDYTSSPGCVGDISRTFTSTRVIEDGGTILSHKQMPADNMVAVKISEDEALLVSKNKEFGIMEHENEFVNDHYGLENSFPMAW